MLGLHFPKAIKQYVYSDVYFFIPASSFCKDADDNHTLFY